jgi:hypothetical protein
VAMSKKNLYLSVCVTTIALSASPVLAQSSGASSGSSGAASSGTSGSTGTSGSAGTAGTSAPSVAPGPAAPGSTGRQTSPRGHGTGARTGNG